MSPTACAGSSIIANSGVAAKAPPDPNPPFETPANITAGIASAKKVKSNVMIAAQVPESYMYRIVNPILCMPETR
jgi:hypothetical protein